MPRRVRAREPLGRALGPAPDGGDLTFELECRLDPRAVRGERHEVIIHADWTVTTPHDLTAERVAAAFGAYTSCVPLVDVTVPAIHDVMPSICRQHDVAPRRFGARGWRLPTAVQKAGCCERVTFRTLAEASSHPYHVAHLSRGCPAPVWQLREVAAQVAERWRQANRERASSLGVERHVIDAAMVDALWDHGIDADDIRRLAQAVSVIDAPLPRAYFTGARYNRVDLEWVSQVIEGRPTPEIAEWAVSLPASTQRTDPQRWRAWLAYGVPVSQVRSAVDVGGDPAIVDHLVSATGWSPPAAARLWVEWARVGCTPTVEHFAALAAHGTIDAVPSSRAIERLVREVDGLEDPAQVSPHRRTELAVLLALLGTVAGVVAVARQGVTSRDDLPLGPSSPIAPPPRTLTTPLEMRP